MAAMRMLTVLPQTLTGTETGTWTTLPEMTPGEPIAAPSACELAMAEPAPAALRPAAARETAATFLGAFIGISLVLLYVEPDALGVPPEQRDLRRKGMPEVADSLAGSNRRRTAAHPGDRPGPGRSRAADGSFSSPR